MLRGSAALIAGVLLACSGTAVIDFEDDRASAGAGSGAGSSSVGPGPGSSGVGGGVDPSCACDAPPWPVCGADGSTYDAGCGDDCVPVAVVCDGACPCERCDELAAEYRQLLDASKQCNAALAVEQCTEKVPGGLPCGCNTFINPSREAYPKLLEIWASWAALECDANVQCEACPPDPVAGVCQSDAGNGRIDACGDRFER